MEYTEPEYQLLLIFHHIIEMFIIRHKHKPQFKKESNLFVFWTNDL